MKTRLPNPPRIDIQWGMLQPECERKFKTWVEECINQVLAKNVPVNVAAKEIYENIKSVGYEEGYESAHADQEGEGW